MDYSVNSLTTAAECDVMISLATKEKNNLTARKLTLEQKQADYAKNSVVVAVELQSVTAEFTAYQAIIPSLPEGQAKEDSITRMKKLEVKLRVLNGKKEDYGNIAVLDKQFDYARAAKELEEADAFLAAVTARKAQL